MSKRKSKKKMQQQCFADCPYFPDATCENYITDGDGVKHRFPPKVLRCCFDNHPINWNTPCPLKLLGSSTHILKSFEFPDEFLTDYEREYKQKAQKEWEKIINSSNLNNE